MTIPVFYLGCALLFWGMETANLPIALAAAFLLEGCHLVREKWHLTEDDFIRISDLTSVIFLTAIGLILLNEEPIRFFRLTTIWLPLILLPLIGAQLYSTSDTIVIGTQIGAKSKKTFRHQPTDFRIIYLAVCFIGAAAANSRSPLFFPGSFLLLCWLLYVNRGRGYPVWVFFTGALLVTITAYSASLSVVDLHHYLQQQSRVFWRGFYLERFADPFKSHIAYGNTGRLKLSGKILFRLDPGSAAPPPLLLEANYNIFTKNSWHNNLRPFAIIPLVTADLWHLAPPPHPAGKQLVIEQNLPREKGLLVRPNNSFLLVAPNLYELKGNREGTLQATDCAPIVLSTFTYHGSGLQRNDLPDQRNLQIPAEEREAIRQVSKEIWQQSQTDSERIHALKRFFADHFSYTLKLQDRGVHATPLANFLLSTRQGHCELFATATTLMLRTAKIPTRYATGYVVKEYSKLEGKYIVRARHAHAWAEAYIDNRWQMIDTTPADWPAIDSLEASWLEPVRDIFGWLKQKYDRFRITGKQEYNLLLSAVLVILSLILILRIYRRMQMQKVTEQQRVAHRKTFAAPSSPFTGVVAALDRIDVSHTANEPFLRRLARIGEQEDIDIDHLTQLYGLHQKLRFDPEHFTTKDDQFLTAGCRQAIEGITRILSGEQAS